jgi:hypothetical protein
MGLYGLSLLTKRQFLIDITAPCNFSHLFMPNQVNWLPSQYNLSGLNITRYDCMRPRKNLDNCLEQLNYINETNTALTTDILVLNTNYDWLSYFSRNKNLEKQILNLGLFNSTSEFQLPFLFHSWYGKLFKLAEPFQRQYNLIKKKARMNNMTQVFCAQIRIGGKRPNVAYDAQFNSVNVTKLFWKFMRENFTQNMANDTNWKIFVTSDFESVEQEAMNEFGKDKVIRIHGVNSHIDRERNLGNNCSRIEKPIMDFHFLQNCDKAVISYSGFGRFGLYNRKYPNKNVYAISG